MKRTLNVYSFSGVEVVTSEVYDWIAPEAGIVLLGSFEVEVPEFFEPSFDSASAAAKVAWERSAKGLRSRVKRENGEWKVISAG